MRRITYKGKSLTPTPYKVPDLIGTSDAKVVSRHITCPHCHGTRIDDRIDLAPYCGCTDCGFQFLPADQLEPVSPNRCMRCGYSGFVRVEQINHPPYHMCGRCGYRP